MLTIATICAATLVFLFITSALFLRYHVAPRMPRDSSSEGFSRAWPGEDGNSYRMDLNTGAIVSA